MRRRGRCKGNPLDVHAEVEGREEAMFDLRPKLFRETTAEIFRPRSPRFPRKIAAHRREPEARPLSLCLAPGAAPVSP